MHVFYQLCVQDSSTEEWCQDGDEERWDSVLDVYQSGSSSRGAPYSNTMEKLIRYIISQYPCATANNTLRNPQIESLFLSLNSLLSSSRPNESISEELAEMIGFENIDLVLEMLDGRESICYEVISHCQPLPPV